MMLCKAKRETGQMAGGKSDISAASAAKRAEDEIEAILRKVFTSDLSLGAVLKFIHPGAGVVVIDGRKVPNEVHRRDVPADCTVHVDALLNLSILQGHVDQNTAFRHGKIRIVGDVSVVTRLRPLMMRQANAASSGARE
jgi:putative sterol carrier protein